MAQREALGVLLGQQDGLFLLEFLGRIDLARVDGHLGRVGVDGLTEQIGLLTLLGQLEPVLGRVVEPADVLVVEHQPADVGRLVHVVEAQADDRGEDALGVALLQLLAGRQALHHDPVALTLGFQRVRTLQRSHRHGVDVLALDRGDLLIDVVQPPVAEPRDVLGHVHLVVRCQADEGILARLLRLADDHARQERAVGLEELHDVAGLGLGHFEVLVILGVVRIDAGGLDVQRLRDQVVDLLRVGGIIHFVHDDELASLTLDFDRIVALAHRDAADGRRVQALDEVRGAGLNDSPTNGKACLHDRQKNHRRRHHGQDTEFLVAHRYCP